MQEKNNSMSVTSFLTSIFKYSIATWINCLIYGVSLLLVAWFLSPEVYGPLDIFISTSTLLMNICILGLDNSFIRFFHEPPNPLDKNGLFSACFGVSAFFLVVTAFVSCVFFPQQVLGIFFAQPLNNIYLVLLFFNAFMAMIGRYVNILYRMDGNIKLYTLESVLMQFFTKLFYLGAVFFNPTFENLVLWTIIGMFLFSLAFLWLNRSRFHLKASILFSKANRQLMPYGLALAPTAIMLWLNSLFSKVYISKTIGNGPAGVFSMVSTLSNVVAMVQAGFATFWSAFIYANYKTEQEKIKQVHDYLTFLIVSFFCLLVAFEDVIFLFLGPGYQEGMAVFPIMLLVPVFAIVSETTVYGISIARKPVFDTIGIGISVVFNIVLCIILAPSFGLYGVCIALAVANIAMFLFRTIIGQKLYCSILSPKRTALVLALLLVITGLATFFTYHFAIKLLVSFIGLGLYILIYRKQLQNALQLAKELLSNVKNKKNPDAE